MADAKGSSAAAGGVAGGAPHGPYQALMASFTTPGGGAPNGRHQYHHAGLIHPHVAMPPMMPGTPPAPYAPPQLAATPPPQRSPQSHLLPHGGYQDWPGFNDAATQQAVPRSFMDLTMWNSAFMPVAHHHAAAYGNNCNGVLFHHNLAPCCTAWPPNHMLRNHCCSAYPPAMEDHQAHPFHSSNNHEKDSGFVTNFRVDPSSVPASPFPPLSPASNNGSSAQIFNEATFTEKASDLEDPLVFTSTSDMKSEDSDELDHAPVGELPSSNESHESWTARFNCSEYHIALRKDLTNSDVGNIGRIVLPKRDAEASLPGLLDRDGMILKMDDFKLPVTWNFKYRFWPNNKSRMYILETTGEFVKSHGLLAGDILIIYKSPESGKLVVRGEKASLLKASVPCPECSNSEECRFSLSLETKRT